MDPIIATGVINLGSTLINKVLPKTPNDFHSNKVNFDKDLTQFTEAKVLSSSEISDLRKEVLSLPGVKEFLSKNEGNSISIDKMSDGSVRLLSTSGDFMTLRPDHPSSALVSKYFDSSISASTNLNQQRPNSVILTG
jgi:hypothetical protein